MNGLQCNFDTRQSASSAAKNTEGAEQDCEAVTLHTSFTHASLMTGTTLVNTLRKLDGDSESCDDHLISWTFRLRSLSHHELCESSSSQPSR